MPPMMLKFVAAIAALSAGAQGQLLTTTSAMLAPVMVSPMQPDFCAGNNCKMGESCIPEPKQCIRAPCPQFRCERDPCAAVRCGFGLQCVVTPKQCIRAPCPQFSCEAETGQLCPKNEEWTNCGSSSCWEDKCDNGKAMKVGPMCTADCRQGCRCETGFYRDSSTNQCVSQPQCESGGEGGGGPRACCMAMMASCLACAAGYDDPVSFCNSPSYDGSAPDCDAHFNCKTREVFNPSKQAFCFKSPPKPVVEESSCCPQGVSQVNCFVNPCQSAKCPAHPDAVCHSNNCGGCNFDFFKDGMRLKESDCTKAGGKKRKNRKNNKGL